MVRGPMWVLVLAPVLEPLSVLLLVQALALMWGLVLALLLEPQLEAAQWEATQWEASQSQYRASDLQIHERLGQRLQGIFLSGAAEEPGVSCQDGLQGKEQQRRQHVGRPWKCHSCF